MALPVVATKSSNKAASSSVAVTAPTGITTGDTLLASVTSFRFSGTTTITAPAGWTQLHQAGDEKVKTAAFKKIAVSADETESNYTFTSTTGGSADEITASILRITGAAAGNEITVSEIDTIANGTDTVISHTASSTPPTGETLVVMATGGGGFTIGGAIVTTSAYTSTNSLTWTEQMDDGFRNGGSDGSSHSVATAPYTGTTEFTAYGYTRSVDFDEEDTGILIFVSAPESATGTNALLSVSPTHLAQAGVAGTIGTNTLLDVSPTMLDQSGRGETPTVWTPEVKTATTWTPEIK